MKEDWEKSKFKHHVKRLKIIGSDAPPKEVASRRIRESKPVLAHHFERKKKTKEKSHKKL